MSRSRRRVRIAAESTEESEKDSWCLQKRLKAKDTGKRKNGLKRGFGFKPDPFYIFNGDGNYGTLEGEKRQ